MMTQMTDRSAVKVALTGPRCRASNRDPGNVTAKRSGLDPQPPNSLSSIAELITGSEALSIQINGPVLDLNITRGNSPATFRPAGF